MTCNEARDALLDADPDDLDGRGDLDGLEDRTSVRDQLRAHIAECSECARIASVIRAEMADLDTALTTLVRTADAGMTTSHEDVVPIGSARSRFMHRVMAAAAAIACVTAGAALFQREMSARAGAAYPLYLPPLPVTAGPVNASGDGAVAVMKTSNPKITVVWYFKAPRGKS